MPQNAHFKLGAKRTPPGRPKVSFRAHVNSSQLPAPPAEIDPRGQVSQPWQMMLNDELGDCTIAAIGHMQLLMSSLNALRGIGSVSFPTDPQILAAYIRVTGQEGAAYNPQTGANDNGCVIPDTLDDWMRNGVGANSLETYADLDVTNEADLIESIFLFGAIDLGVNLPAAWQNADVWDAPSRWHRFGKWAPGSWGGHCVPAIGYNAKGIWIITWGAPMFVTWAAVQMFFTDAYAPIDSLWVTQRSAPNGFDHQALLADAAQVGRLRQAA